MSLEIRSSSAAFKRAEQLKRWEESDTNREPVSPKQKSRKIKFSSGCVFLAACAAGDKDEVLKLLEKGADINTANVDGLTALHQACIDDNFDMVEFLVEHGADVNRGDNEGWTPLHATASCGFMYIAKYLIEKGADVAAVNNDGELAVDIAECQKMEDLLNEEIKKRGIDCESARNEERRLMLQDALEWLSAKNSQIDIPHPKNGATPLHVAAAKGYTDVMKILLQCGADIDSQDADGWTPLHAAAHWGQKEACQLLSENLADMDARNFVGQTSFDLADTDMLRYLEDLKKKQNKEEVNRRQAKKRAELQDRTIEIETPIKVKKVETDIVNKDENRENNIEKKNRVNSMDSVNVLNKNVENSRLPPSVPPKQIVDTNNENNLPSWRKQNTRQNKVDLPSPVKTTDKINTELNSDNDVTLRRPTSLQTDKEFYSKYEELHARIKAYRDSDAIIPYSSTRPYSDYILNSYKKSQKNYSDSKDENVTNITTTSTSPTKTTSTSPATSPVPNSQPLRRSFVPPVRDEESETQRKAHAKRVRETRRSTQGVTLEEIKSAEQFVKKKNNQPNNNNNNNTNEPFKLEDATKPSSEPQPPSTPSFIRRTSASSIAPTAATTTTITTATTTTTTTTSTPIISNTSTTTTTSNTQNNNRPLSAPVESVDTTVTLPLRRPKSHDEKEQDKENDVRNAQATLATQAAIQRRRRPKRRSTGVVSFDNVDDLEQEKDPSTDSYDDATKVNHQESGNERSRRNTSTTDTTSENGEIIDYKKLYEQAMVENEQLREKLRKNDAELRDTKQTLEKINSVTSKNSLSELEKRERRAMERKLSEMEEELKHLENMRIENQKLKDENGALIRVISKLSK